jgi:hypothetical protein
MGGSVDMRTRNDGKHPSPANLRLRCAVIVMAFLIGTYGNVGALDPIISIGPPGAVEMLNATPPSIIDCEPIVMCVTDNASRRVCLSGFSASGRLTPNKIPLAGFTAPTPIFQCDRSRIFESCIAKNRDSGSPSIYRRFTEPGLADNTFSISAASCALSERHATTPFNFSVSNLAAAASISNFPARSLAPAASLKALAVSSRDSEAFWLASAARAPASAIDWPADNLYRSNSSLESAISSLCNWTTAYVAMPTTIADSAAAPSDITIKFSQV